MKKVILVTGASRGLGQKIYQHLLAKGSYIVYGTSRTPQASGLLSLDISSEASVKSCIELLMKQEGQIDVVINNVGSNLIGSLEATTIEDYEGQMALNLYGAIRVIQEVLPRFRQQKSGRFINISSIGGSIPLPFNSSYGASKAALEAMSESLAYELESSNIYVSVIQPLGLTIEDEVPNLTYVKDEKSWHVQSQQLLDAMMQGVGPSVSKAHVAKKVASIIEKKEPKLYYRVGSGAGLMVIMHQMMPNRWFRKILKHQLFKNSQ